MTIARLLHLSGRLIVVGGKGGVGKTTVAAAIASEMDTAGLAPVLVSTDPAHSAGDALGVTLGPEPAAVPGFTSLQAMEVDAAHERRIFLNQYGSALATLLERGTYLDRSDVEEVTGLTLPGMDEVGAMLRLLRLVREQPGPIVLDTAPTGHTLRLLQLPTEARTWLDVLGAMQSKHEAIAAAFSAATAGDEATRFLEQFEADLQGLEQLLTDAGATQVVLVTTGEPVTLAETGRYSDALGAMNIQLAGIVVNRHNGQTPALLPSTRIVFLPPLYGLEAGREGLWRVTEAVTTSPDERARPQSSETHDHNPLPRPFRPPVDRKLYLVGGKGGVGKSTVAATVATGLSREGLAVLLLSIDPAGSLGDILGREVSAEPISVADEGGLFAQQLDPMAVWQDFEEAYRQNVDAIFAELLGTGLSATHDQAIVERLIDLAPPGMDEIMAMVEVVDSIQDGPYDAVVVDTAPTGHFLRFLEMPSLALEWTHALLRLLLKYREVVRLGGLAERVLSLARSLKSLRDQFSSGSDRWLVVVTTPDSLVVPETERLFARLGELHIPVNGLLVNRYPGQGPINASTADVIMKLRLVARDVPISVGPALPRGPIGAEELYEFGSRWHTLDAAGLGPNEQAGTASAGQPN